MNGAHALKPTGVWSTLCAAVMVVTLILGIWYGLRRPHDVRAAYGADWPIALVMALGTLPASNAWGVLPDAIVLAATVTTEIGMAWLYIRWGVFLGCLDLRTTVACIFSAHVVGCTIKMLLNYVPDYLAVCAIALLPLLSVGMLHRAGLPKRSTEESGDGVSGVLIKGDSTLVAGFGGPILKVAAYLLMYRLISQAVGTFMPRGMSGSLSMLCCLAEIIVSLLIVYMLFIRSGSFTFHQVWSIFLVLMALAIVLGIPPETYALASSISFAAGSLIVMFSWLVFADIAHHSSLHPFVVFGVARMAYEIPRIIVGPLGLMGFEPDQSLLPSALLFVLFVFSIYFFDKRDPTLDLIFSDFRERAPLVEQTRLADICRDVAHAYGLSDREETVLLYLCQGRSRAYVAETLYLSENTVRNYTQRIYTKLDVHSKTELQRRLGV